MGRWAAVPVTRAILVAVALGIRAFVSGDDGAADAGGAAATTEVRVVTPPPPVPAARAAPDAIRPKPPTVHEKEKAKPEEREPYVQVRPGREAVLHDDPGGEVVGRVEDETKFGSPTVLSVAQVHNRWLGVPTPQLPNGKLGWVRADPGTLRGGYTDVRVVVDLSSHEARIIKGSDVIRRWTVTVGAPESPTPTGRFAVTDLFEGDLNPAYGCCAVALTATQPDLPSGWQGGDRIAFHGTDGALGVDASNGCIRSADRDVRAMLGLVPLGAPVLIRG
jgi:lipoprotein-anchoring transpeptidase ErfK/SrfK